MELWRNSAQWRYLYSHPEKILPVILLKLVEMMIYMVLMLHFIFVS